MSFEVEQSAQALYGPGTGRKATSFTSALQALAAILRVRLLVWLVDIECTWYEIEYVQDGSTLVSVGFVYRLDTAK